MIPKLDSSTGVCVHDSFAPGFDSYLSAVLAVVSFREAALGVYVQTHLLFLVVLRDRVALRSCAF